MINHDTIFNNSKVQSNYYAETDVSVLKFERSVFEDIIKQFPDIKEDLNKICYVTYFYMGFQKNDIRGRNINSIFFV